MEVRGIFYKTIRYSAAPALMAALWFLSSRPLDLPDLGPSGMDKVAHFIAYAVLAFAMGLWARPEWWQNTPVITACLVILAAACYGAVDEVHQSFVPGRDPSFFDWIADSLGAAFGAFVFSRGVKKLSDTPLYILFLVL